MNRIIDSEYFEAFEVSYGWVVSPKNYPTWLSHWHVVIPRQSPREAEESIKKFDVIFKNQEAIASKTS